MVSWNTLIVGYTNSGNAVEGLRLFQEMVQKGMMPNEITFLCALNACASLGSLDQGRNIHSVVMRTGMKCSTSIENTLIDLYAKCGSIKDACQVFAEMSERDNVSWNAMMAGFSQHGLGEQALKLLDQMHQGGVKVNQITFVGILSACSHAGLVDQGCLLFSLMNKDYAVTPTEEHYACMVDLFGRAGHLNAAAEFIENLPSQPNVTVLRALLGACRIHNDLEKAKQAAQCIINLEPQHDGAYMLLANMYAAAGRWNNQSEVINMMKDRGAKVIQTVN